MDLRYRAGVSIRHGGGAVIEALLVAAVTLALVVAASLVTGTAPAGAGLAQAGGRLSATITMGDGLRAAAVPAGTAVTFAVTRTVPDNDPVMWVTNRCFDAAGRVVSSVDRAVQWGAATSLEGTAGTFTAAGATCTAYATLKPWRNAVLGDAVITYAVGG